MKKFFYRVQSSDSIISVSKKFNVPTYLLISENNLKCEISAGDILFISPCERTYHVQPLDTLEDIADKLLISKEKLCFLNGGITHVFYGLVLGY